MADLNSDARLCYAIICLCITNDKPVRDSVPLQIAMVKLQKRYGGAFPALLKGVWNDIKHPTDDLDFNASVEKQLLEWFEKEYLFTKENCNGEATGSESAAGGSESGGTRQFDDWASPVEEGISPSEKSNTGDSSDGKRKKRSSKSSKDDKH